MKKNNLNRIGVLCLLSLSMTGCGMQRTNLPAEEDFAQLTAPESPAPSPTALNILEIDEPLQDTDCQDPPESTVAPDCAAAAMDFSLRLTRQCLQTGENTLISPLSVLTALGMTANGADQETLAQMEQLFGVSVPQLNQFLEAYIQNLPQGDKYRVSLANSIWIREDMQPAIPEEFLKTVSQWYDAGIYAEPFTDSTLDAVNGWVSEHTEGMIPEIIDQIDPYTVMYLINALAFDAEWDQIYTETEVHDGTFTAADGSLQDAVLMYSTEWAYLEDENAAGFLKYYADQQYAFAALLPREGMSTADYMDTLTGESLSRLLAEPQEVEVYAVLPKYQCEYSAELSGILQQLGLTDAFDQDSADFSSMGGTPESPFYIGRVLHKTYMAVDERGTKAGAATSVEMDCGSAMMPTKTVILDRPFVYLLIDCSQGLPLFMGTVERIE